MRPDPDLWNDSTSVDSGDLISSAKRVDLPHVEAEEEPTMRAGTDSLIRGAPSEGRARTIDEPTVERDRPSPPPELQRQTGQPSPTSRMRKQKPPSAPGENKRAGKLIVEAGNDNGRTFELTGDLITIGRALGNSIVLTDIAVSRKHLSLEFVGTQYKLIDHASGNGTLINDRLETGTCLLRHGDQLELGNTVFRFEHPASRNIPVPPMGIDPGPPETEDFDDDRVEEIARTVPGDPIPSSNRQPSGRPTTAGRRRKKPITLPPPHSLDGLALPGANGGLSAAASSGQMPGPPALNPSFPHESRPGSQRPGHTPMPAMTGSAPQSLSSRGTPPSPSIENLLPGPSPRMSTGDDYGMDPNHPMFATAPGPGRAGSHVSLRPNNRKLVVGLLVAAVAVVLVAISVLLTRTSSSDEVAASEISAPNATKTADATGDTSIRAIPETTWGTNETVLVASIGASVVPQTEPATKKIDSASPQDSKSTTGSNSSPEPGIKPKSDTTAVDPASTTTGQKNDDGAAENPPANTPPESKISAPATSKTKTASTKSKKKPVRTAAKRRSTPKRKTSAANVATSKKTAASQYRGKKFSTAATTLRNAAKKTSGKQAKSLLSTASSYAKVGSLISKGNTNQARNPVTALSAYDQAYRLDKRVGGGAHSSFLRGKLSIVAPKAAASHMAKAKYESAKTAADKAAVYGAGNSAMVKRVRKGLESKAGEFYKSALRMKSKQPAKAKKTLQRIMKMVPAKSPSYTKAHKLLSKLS